MIKRYKSIFKESQNLNQFLDKFPNNTKNWSEATDELRDICKTAREYIEEFDYKKIKPLNFKFFDTPSEWNTKSKKYIKDVYKLMSDKCKKQFNEYLKDHFKIDN